MIRTSYGPYTLGLVPNPNDLVEVRVTKELTRLMHNYYKDKTKETQMLIDRQKNQIASSKSKKSNTLAEDDQTKENLIEENERIFDVEIHDTPHKSGLGEKLLKGDK